MAHPYAPPGYGVAPRRRRRRWPWVLLVVVVVLLAVAVAIDRVALGLAEDKAATTLQSSQDLSTTPDVSVAGFPFLTQLAAGEFDEITISAHDVSSDRAAGIELSDVTVHLHDVTVSDDYSTVTARTATADGHMTYAELSRVLGTQVTSDGAGRLVAKPSVTIAGRTYSGTVSANVEATRADGIHFTDPKIVAAGAQLPSAVTEALATVFDKGISLAGLPFGISVDSVRVGTSALELTLTGSNVSYSR